MATILRTDGTKEALEITTNSTTNLAALQAAVGGYIEMIMLSGGRALIVNEEGLLHSLPHNRAATNIYKLEPLVGNAVLLSAEEVQRDASEEDEDEEDEESD